MLQIPASLSDVAAKSTTSPESRLDFFTWPTTGLVSRAPRMIPKKIQNLKSPSFCSPGRKPPTTPSGERAEPVSQKDLASQGSIYKYYPRNIIRILIYLSIYRSMHVAGLCTYSCACISVLDASVHPYIPTYLPACLPACLYTYTYMHTYTH